MPDSNASHRLRSVASPVRSAEVEDSFVNPNFIGDARASAGGFESCYIDGNGDCEDVFVDIEGSSRGNAVKAFSAALSGAEPRSAADRLVDSRVC